MPDVSTREEYEGYLERLANQTHPEILADNVEILRTEVDKFDKHLETVDENRRALFHNTVRILGCTALGAFVGEVVALS